METNPWPTTQQLSLSSLSLFLSMVLRYVEGGGGAEDSLDGLEVC